MHVLGPYISYYMIIFMFWGDYISRVYLRSPAPAQRDALQAEGFGAGVGGVTGCPLTPGGQVGGGAVAGAFVVTDQIVTSGAIWKRR